MSQKKLECLFYSFIKYREEDEVDGICQAGNTGGHRSLQITRSDNTSPRIQREDFVTPLGLGIVPSSPLQTIPYASLPPSQANDVANVGRQLAQLVEQHSSGCDDKSNISFETCCMFVEPEEQNISVCIVRSDKCCNRVTKVEWKTCDKTAQSGKHYVESCGEIVFNEGETKKSIQIGILKFKDEAIDLRFKVELNDVNGIYNPKPLTVTLKKTANFYGFERDVLNSLPSVPFSVDALRFALGEQLSTRAFHVALSHLCSTEEALQTQLALAFELSRLCLRQLKDESILNILKDYFRMDMIDF